WHSPADYARPSVAQSPALRECYGAPTAHPYSLTLHDALPISAVLDLTEDDFDFLTSNKVWIATDRSRARRCVEACVYGTLDFVGYPRFPAPVEFIAAVIAYYVHPVNIQTACLIM